MGSPDRHGWWDKTNLFLAHGPYFYLYFSLESSYWFNDLRSREKKPRCGEGWVSNPTLRLCGRRGLTRYQDYRISAFKHLTVSTYLNLILDFNKQLNCTCCLKLFQAEGYNIVPRHIRLLLDYCRRESWVTGVYWIYKEFITTTSGGMRARLILRIHAQW